MPSDSPCGSPETHQFSCSSPPRKINTENAFLPYQGIRGLRIVFGLALSYPPVTILKKKDGFWICATSVVRSEPEVPSPAAA